MSLIHPFSQARTFSRVIERLGALDGRTGKFGKDFLSTHPSSDTRVQVSSILMFEDPNSLIMNQNMEKHLPKAYDMLQSNPSCGSVRKELEPFKASVRAVRMGKDGEIVLA